MQLTAERAHALKEHRRSLAGRTGCGLCGTESLDQLARRAAPVRLRRLEPWRRGARTVRSAGAGSTCFSLTGAVHAAAWCDLDGGIELLREDVGRHNALDKLIGALASRRRPASMAASS
jgi:formate dehydrogenase accessory protein FdhD